MAIPTAADTIPALDGYALQSRPSGTISKPLAECSSMDDYDSFLNALAVPDAFSADDSLPPVRSLPGEDPSWLVPTTSPPQRQQNVFQPQDQYRRQQQEQELQHGRQWAASPTSVGDHSVPELRLPSGAVWGHHVPAGQQPASADPHRQRILMAAHERAVRSMQHRQQSVQVPGTADRSVGSFPPAPCPQPATPQLEERHTTEDLAVAALEQDAPADWRKRKQKQARQTRKQTRSGGLPEALQPSASAPQSPSVAHFGAEHMHLPGGSPQSLSAEQLWPGISTPKPELDMLQMVAQSPRAAASLGGENEQPQDKNKLRERNRVAQKRYREGQKRKMADTEEQVTELTARLNALATEKATLAARYDLLQKLLTVTRTQPMAPPERMPLASAEAIPTPQAEAGSSSYVDSRCLRLLNGYTLDVLLRRLGASPGVLPVTIRQPVTHLTSQHVADMLPETYTLMCEDYKAAFARLLAEPRNDSDPAFVHQVSQLAWEAMAFKVMVGTTHPGYCTDIQVLDAADTEGTDDGSYGATQPPVAPSSAPIKVDSGIDVRALVDEVRFSADQAAAVVGFRSVFLRNLAILLCRRREACSALQAALAVPGADAQQQVAEAHRRTTEAMLALRSTLRDEHYYLLQLRFALFLDVLTPMQMALIYARTYPSSVDVVTMSNCVATDFRQPAAVEVLRSSDATGGSDLMPIFGQSPPSLAVNPETSQWMQLTQQ